MKNNLKLNYIILVIFISNIGFLNAQSETGFYQAPSDYKIIVDLVKDYKADNSFETDDSKVFQKAINTISKNGGGKLIVPKGHYTISDIKMKSNVHIVFDSEVVIRPSHQKKQRNFSIFSFGQNSAVVENFSLSSNNPDKNYTIDLTKTNCPRVTVFAIRNADNFLFSNVRIKDVQTIFSSFTLGITEYKGQYYSPRNGIIRNSTTTNADYGYGLIQSQAARNIFFNNLGGQGGVTLRLETGAKEMNNVQVGGNHDILAKNIECHDGNAAVMISPHAMKNGIVTVDGVTAVNCGFGVRIGAAYVAKKYHQDIGLKPGSYDPRSSVKNVTATLGTTAQVKPKHYRYIPREYQTNEHTTSTPITNTFSNPVSTKDSHARLAVSVAAVGYFSGIEVSCMAKNGKTKKIPAMYSIQIDEQSVKAIGFEYQRPIIDITDDVTMECTRLK